VALAACPIMAGVVTFLMGHDSRIELAASRMMAGEPIARRSQGGVPGGVGAATSAITREERT
jgi:hypothetical protein